MVVVETVRGGLELGLTPDEIRADLAGDIPELAGMLGFRPGSPWYDRFADSVTRLADRTLSGGAKLDLDGKSEVRAIGGEIAEFGLAEALDRSGLAPEGPTDG